MLLLLFIRLLAINMVIFLQMLSIIHIISTSIDTDTTEKVLGFPGSTWIWQSCPLAMETMSWLADILTDCLPLWETQPVSNYN